MSSSASATENSPIVNSVSRSSLLEEPDEDLAHVRATQGERDQLVRYVRDRGDDHDRGPAADRPHAEHCQRLAPALTVRGSAKKAELT